MSNSLRLFAPNAVPSGAADEMMDAMTTENGDDENTVAYDMARHRASVLSGLLLARLEAATNPAERNRWSARRRLVKQQARALDPGDREALLAQQQAWADEAYGIRNRGAAGDGE